MFLILNFFVELILVIYEIVLNRKMRKLKMRGFEKFSEDEKKPMGKLARAVNVVTDHMAKTFVPKRLIGDIREIWMLQGRMLFRRGKRPLGVLEHPRFRAGYDFLELRGIVGEIDPQLVEWWEQFQTLNPIE